MLVDTSVLKQFASIRNASHHNFQPTGSSYSVFHLQVHTQVYMIMRPAIRNHQGTQTATVSDSDVLHV